MKNNQRKNKKSLVLVAMILMIGLVAGMGAMTYSRYITTGTTTQTATAAKWGFVVNVNADNLFGTQYGEVADKLAKVTTSSTGIVVKTDATADVVAPGTKGSMTFSISGEAEVLAKITISVTNVSEIFDGISGYPVKWTLTKTVNSTTDTLVTAGRLSDVVTAINTGATTIQPGDPATSAGTYELSWAWAFDVDETTNLKDTVIGMKANNASVAFTDIENLYVGSTRIGTVYDATKLAAVVTTLSFDLVINIEQVQA